MRRLNRLVGRAGLALALLAAAGSAHAVLDYRKFRTWQMDKGQCLAVRRGDMRPGVQLGTAPCNPADPAQAFFWQDDGHLVANNGSPNAAGQRLCVDSDGQAILLQPCRRLTTGDRQWWWRNPWGFIQNNYGLECMGVSSLERTKVVVRGCAENLAASWMWFPYTHQDELQQVRERAQARASGRIPNMKPTYDPEPRSRWEDMVRDYGPYIVVKDVRTGFCIQPDPYYAALVAGWCGRKTQRFHFSREGMLREVTADGKLRGVSGLCAQAPLRKGAYITLEPCDARKPEQRWWLVNGQIQTQSRAAGNRCMDIANESRQRNADLIAWDCDGRRPGHQTFQITYEREFKPSYL
jgi:hypothetical protein